MKVLFLTDPLVTTAGAVRPALLLAKQMQLLGHDVEIGSTQIAEPIVRTLELEGIRHSVVGSNVTVGRSFSTLFAWAKSLVRPTRLNLSDENVVVINTSSCILVDSKIYYAQGIMTKALDAISQNFPPSQQCAYQFLSPWLKLLEHRLVQKFRKSAELFVANSKFCASLYRDWGIKVNDIIYPPLDTTMFKPSTANPSEDYVLTHLGTFEKEGNFSLIQTIANLGVKVKVFGSSSSRLHRFEHKNITFMGKVSNEELVDLYSNAVFTLFAFNHEPFGYIPVESLACGTPVLTFNRQGPSETVTDNQTGWLAKTNKELVEKALHIWTQGIDRNMRATCRKKALSYDVKQISKKWVTILENGKMAPKIADNNIKLQHREAKIIMVIPSLSMLGGAQRVCLHTIKALRKTGCKIVLATIDKTDWALVEKIYGEASKPDEKLYFFSKMPEMPILALKQAFIAFSYLFLLFSIKTRNKKDLIINMGGEIVDSLGNIVYINAIPLRLMHLFPEIQPRQGIHWGIYSRLFSVFMKVFGDSADITVTNSKFTQGIIQKHMQKTAFIVNPPINSQKIKSHREPDDRKNTIVTVSRFRSAKGLTIIPQIAAFLKNCEFILIGTVDSGSENCLNELAAQIKQLQVQDQVHIFKNKPYTFTLKTLSTAKVFLNTQSTEAFGMAIVESMAAGCVPVVPRAGGPWLEILDQQEGLYGFSFKNPREAAEKIELLISDENLRREISSRAVERALIFDSSAFEKRFLHLVETISSNKERDLTKK